jgi:hypothetical protein
VLALLLAASLGCAASGAGAADVAARATGLALTAAAVLTSTQGARPPTPTPTAVPSATLAPTPTATSTTAPATETNPPPATPTPCVNDSAFVTDVNVPDGTHFSGGAGFTKTWRLRNDGTCTWTTAYTLRYIAGDALGGSQVNVPNEVPPGATLDLSVALTAPAGGGSFRGNWQLHSPAGEPFGTKPYVDIRVP